MPRLRTLDGLRALAVLAVIGTHFGGPYATGAWDVGSLGVRLFLVVSGFLITGILVDARAAAAPDGRAGVLRAFYSRRALRIAPAYYLVLGLAVLAVPEVRDAWVWHATYLSNMHMALQGAWDHGIIHFWSLAVEEQFYLLWPYAVLFMSERALRRLAIGLLVAAPVSRALLYGLTANSVSATTPLIAVADTLAIGALLAYRWRSSGTPVPAAIGLAGIVGLAAGAATQSLGIGFAGRLVALDTFAALFFVWLVDHAARNGRGCAWLAWPPLVFLGTISYSVYLIHNFVPTLIGLVQPALAAWLLQRGLAQWGAVALISIAWATLSWFCFEEPLNRAKKFLPYVRHVKTQPPTIGHLVARREEIA
jgi:peptidoglycan/LPS O-acetylase OafA/YrhL